MFQGDFKNAYQLLNLKILRMYKNLSIQGEDILCVILKVSFESYPYIEWNMCTLLRGELNNFSFKT